MRTRVDPDATWAPSKNKHDDDDEEEEERALWIGCHKINNNNNNKIQY